MASVRMSEKLREQIMTNAHKIFFTSEEAAQASLPELFHDKAAQEYVNTFNPYIDKIPADWKATCTKVSYRMMYTLSNDQPDGVAHQMSWSEISLVKPVTIPMLHLIYRETYSGARICTIPFDFKFSNELTIQLGYFRDRVRKVADEQASFCANLRVILGRTNTLKQFIDVWPQGENLIPPEALSTLNEKTVRVKNNNDSLISEEVSKSLSTTLLKRTLMS